MCAKGHAMQKPAQNWKQICVTETLSRAIGLTKAHISSISSLQADSRNNLLSVNNVDHKSQSKLRLFCCCYDFLDSTIKLQRKELLEFFLQVPWFS